MAETKVLLDVSEYNDLIGRTSMSNDDNTLMYKKVIASLINYSYSRALQDMSDQGIQLTSKSKSAFVQPEDLDIKMKS